MKRLNVISETNKYSSHRINFCSSNLVYMTMISKYSLLKGFFVTCCLLLLFISCHEDLDIREIHSSDETTLKIDAVINNDSIVQTKDLLKGTLFPNNSQIGVTVTDESGTTYNKRTYKNIPYTLTAGNWTGLNVFLTSRDANVYAYYPYSEYNNNISFISIDASKSIDYMYASNPKTVNYLDNKITLKMSHVLAVVSLKIAKGVYDKTGKVTELKWNSFSAAKTAYLDGRTGNLSNFTGAGDSFDTNISDTTPATLTDAKVYEFLVVPTGITDRLSFDVTVDGLNYRITSPDIKLLSGNKYNYTLTINYSDLSVSQVTITGWTMQQCGEYIPEWI